MKVLGIDSSGMTATAAILTEDELLAEISVNHKKTHSETLLPMVSELMQMTELSPADMDVLAVAAGPGSFTGLRIGAATIKGLGLALDKPVAAVPTLMALAWNAAASSGVVCPMMDARRNEVYAAAYRMPGPGAEHSALPEELIPGEALPAAEMAERLNNLGEPVLLLGDGADATKDILVSRLTVPYRFAPVHMNRQRAASVAALGVIFAEKEMLVNVDDFEPVYFRKSQAERVRDENAAQRP